MSDTLLGGRVHLAQGTDGLRAGLDAVMLAAAVSARPGQSVLELGLGTGAASLCLAARVPGLILSGVEIDPAQAALARSNAAVNGVALQVIEGDIFQFPQALKRSFDHVLCNPPFHGPGLSSPDPQRASALMDHGTLKSWLKLGLQRTVSGGVFTVIVRADRLGEALGALPPHGLTVIPLWPHVGERAKRVIVRARVGSRAPLALLAGLVLHEADGGWTALANEILRNGAALALNEPPL